MAIQTDFLVRRIVALESAFTLFRNHGPDDEFYEVFRAASIKEFEIVLEQSGKLLRKRLRPYFTSKRQADSLTFKNVFRYAAKHGLISVQTCERWLTYRDNRDHSANDYGEKFAETTLALLATFIPDAREVAEVVATGEHD